MVYKKYCEKTNAQINDLVSSISIGYHIREPYPKHKYKTLK